VDFGSPLKGLGTVGVIEHLTGLGKQGLDMFPYPPGPIPDDAQAHLLFWHHAGLFDLLAGLAALLLVLPLRPTAPMDEPLPIPQRKATALRITPLAAPPRPLGPMAAWAGPAPPGTLRPRGHLGPIYAPHHGRTAPAARCHLRATPLDRVA
jgi:hypothetical protein